MSRLVIQNNNDLREKVNTYFTDEAFKTANPIGTWDVSRVTNMASVFSGRDTFNEPLTDWDVSNVTDMTHMFSRCEVFNQPLDHWNVSRVARTVFMFERCFLFNQPLNNWNVSGMTRANNMFYDCHSFNQPLNNWNVSNCVVFNGMFIRCYSFNQPLNDWDVRSADRMGWMFQSCSAFNQPLNNWNVSGVHSFLYMFEGAISFNQDLSMWYIADQADIEDMFVRTSMVPEHYPQLVNTETDEIIIHQLRPQRPPPPPPAPEPEPPARARPAPTGVAFEVHNRFNNIDIAQLLDAVKSGVGMDVYNGSNLNEEWVTELRALARQTDRASELLPKLDALVPKIRDINFRGFSIGGENGVNVFYTILNFVKRQEKAFKDNYVTFFIEDCFGAYSSGDTTSCVKGVQERMVFALGQAGYNLDNPVYQQLSNAMFQVKDSQLFHFIGACLESAKAGMVGKSMDEKKGLLMECVKSKLHASDPSLHLAGLTDRIQGLIDQSNDMLEDDALSGGRRRRRTPRRKRATRRTRKRRVTHKRKRHAKRRTHKPRA